MYSTQGPKESVPSSRESKETKRTLVHARLADITDCRRLDHVAHSEALDGLVLGDASRAVRAADEVDVAAAFLVAAVVSSLLGLGRGGDGQQLTSPKSS